MTNFVWVESSENKLKIQNLLYTSIFIWFTWILFHFTIIFFFWLVLESVLLVWLFLWIWNVVAMIFDIPIWVLQKYIKPKTFILIAASMMFLVSLIFLKFIYFEWISELLLPNWAGKTISYLWIFLDSALNIFLLLLSASLYWIIKESFDVTVLSYIFNISTPSEYASLISKNNIYTWIWSMVWLILSWILLALNIKIAIIIFTIVIIFFIFFISKFFDNTKETVDFWVVKSFKLDVLKSDLLKKKDELVSKVTPQNIVELSKQSKVIILKPIEFKKSIDFKDVYDTSINWFKVFIKIIFSIPRNLLILWFLAVILQYWFWDTFVSTFQVEFLEKIIWINKENYLIKQTWWLITWYVLLWLIVLPAFLLQDFFINLSKKHWVYKIVMFWIMISSISMFFFWIFKELFLVILFWLINSVWYAASMPLSQAVFWWLYNEDYAKKFNLKQIDSTASAAPLKIVLNFANVIWLILWAILVWTLGFDNFFIFFSFVLGWFFIYSLVNMNKFSGAKLEDEKSEIKAENWDIKKIKDIDSDFI